MDNDDPYVIYNDDIYDNDVHRVADNDGNVYNMSNLIRTYNLAEYFQNFPPLDTFVH